MGGEEDELYWIEPPAAPIQQPAPKNVSKSHFSSAKTGEVRSLGSWYFDNQKKQRRYVALTGKVYTGVEGMKQARTDQFSAQNPMLTARYELKHLMTHITPSTILAQLRTETQSAGGSGMGDTGSGLGGIADTAGMGGTGGDSGGNGSGGDGASGEVGGLQSLSSWGLPAKVLERYKKNKVERLFQWQMDCLTLEDGAVLSGTRNVIYSAPTSGGKTLVAEILMLRRMAQFLPSHDDMAAAGDKRPLRVRDPHTTLFVVPFVALAEEKAAYFQQVWQDLNVGVKAFHGDGGDLAGNVLTEDVELAVCTIERANILLTQLLDEGRENQLKMVVIDEIHMLSDPHRGFLLEVMLSKINFLLKGRVQVVGMSATLPNIADLAGWLEAALYTTQYRPVDLQITVCVNRTVHSVHKLEGHKELHAESQGQGQQEQVQSMGQGMGQAQSQGQGEMQGQGQMQKEGQMQGQGQGPAVPAPVEFRHLRSLSPCDQDPDGLKALCLETVQEGKSVMMFCASKRRCEVCAKLVAEAIYQQKQSAHMQRAAAAAEAAGAAFRAARAAFSQQGQQQGHPQHPHPQQGQLPNPQQQHHHQGPYPGYGLPPQNPPPPHPHLRPYPNQPPEQAQAQAQAQARAAQRQPHLLTAEQRRAQEQAAGRSAMQEALANTQVGLCPVLRQTLPYGCAYHHAGLTLDERSIIEEGFRQGYIQVLCTTSTLSAGVNLPAHRVIIRSPRLGIDFLTVATFRQMCGRAGRLGLDVEGQAVLMADSSKIERDKASELLTADLAPLTSNLHLATGGGLEKLLLEMVCCGRLSREADVLPFVRCTLMHVQRPYHDVAAYSNAAVRFLKKEQFLRSFGAGPLEGCMESTPLGQATTISGIAPKDAVQVMRPLMTARRKLMLRGGLHPVFLVTPPSTPIEPDWANYERMLFALYKEFPEAQPVAEYLGIDHGQLIKYSRSKPPRSPPAQGNSSGNGNDSGDVELKDSREAKEAEWEQACLYRRFFSAILLYTLVQEWPITSVTQIINTERGQLQQLQKDAAVFCGMTVVFCTKLNWHMLAACLGEFSQRLSFGSHRDILPLVRLGAELTPARARVFLKDGIESAPDLLFAGVERLTELLLDTLPYEGRDPMENKINRPVVGKAEDTGAGAGAGSGNGGGAGAGAGAGAGGDYSVPSSRELSRRVCERLARQILHRAREHVQQESARLNSQHTGYL